MKKMYGFLGLLVILVISGSAFAADPLVNDLSESFSNQVFLTVFLLFYFAVTLFMIIIQWKLFVKAGEPGWASLVPIYNAVVLMQISGKPGWWVILMFVPFANIVVIILMDIGLARNFRRSDAFAIGLIFLPIIFLAVLAFDSSRYSPVESTI